MRKIIACLFLGASMFLTGCGGGVDTDLKAPADEVRKTAESLSTNELEARIKELEKRSDELGKKVGDKEPTEAQMKEMTKYVEVGGIYATEMMKKKMK